jgi:hypothetical protein
MAASNQFLTDLFKNLRVNSLIRNAGEDSSLITDAERQSLLQSAGGDINKFKKDFNTLVQQKLSGNLTPAQQELRNAAIARQNAQDKFSTSFTNWENEGGAAERQSPAQLAADRNKGLPTNYNGPFSPATTSPTSGEIMGGSSKVPSTIVQNTNVSPIDRALDMTRPDVVDAEFRELPPLAVNNSGPISGNMGGGGSHIPPASMDGTGRFVGGNLTNKGNSLLNLINMGATSKDSSTPVDPWGVDTGAMAGYDASRTGEPGYSGQSGAILDQTLMRNSEPEGIIRPSSRTVNAPSKSANVPLPPQRPANLGQPTVQQLWEKYNQTGDAADFVRADQAMQKQQPTIVHDESVDNGQKRGGAVKEKPDHVHHALSIISHMLGHKYEK